MFDLGGFALSANALWKPLLMVLGLLVLLVLVTSFLGARKRDPRRRRAEPARRRTASTRRAERSDRTAADAALALAEFRNAMGQSPREYLVRTIVMTAVALVGAALLTGSWALLIAGGIGIPMWRRSRSAGRIRRTREASLSTELLPTATQIATDLGQGRSLAESIRNAIDGPEERLTPFQLQLRRAQLVSGDLESGLKLAADDAAQEFAKEFFEILAESAKLTSRPIDAQSMLERFVATNRRRQAAWSEAQRESARARSTRGTMLLFIPGELGLTLWQVGPDKLFHTFAGNIVILVSFGLMGAAVVMSNRVLRRALEDF